MIEPGQPLGEGQAAFVAQAFGERAPGIGDAHLVGAPVLLLGAALDEAIVFESADNPAEQGRIDPLDGRELGELARTSRSRTPSTASWVGVKPPVAVSRSSRELRARANCRRPTVS